MKLYDCNSDFPFATFNGDKADKSPKFDAQILNENLVYESLKTPEADADTRSRDI